jgi:hypothetical protein
MVYTEVEWARLKAKMDWEGGLIGFMNYGIPTRLYNEYKNEFDEIYKFIDKKKYTKKQNQLIVALELQIESHFTDKVYSDDDLNAVNYVFSE